MRKANLKTKIMKKYTYNKETLQFDECKKTPLTYAMLCILLLIFASSSFIGRTTIVNPTKTVVDTVIIEKYDVFNHIILYDKINSKNKDAFILHTKSIAKRLNIPFEDLLILFELESGINHKAVNKKYPFKDGTYAYGLIQFTPIVRTHLNLKYNELKKLNEFEQLELVYNYFKTNKNKIKSFSDLYILTYLPSYINKSDDHKFPEWAIKSNPSLGKTVGEFKKIINKKYNKLKTKH